MSASNPETHRKLLVGLPEGTPQIKFTTMKKLQSEVEAQARVCSEDNSRSPFLIVSKVPRTILEAIVSQIHEIVAKGLGAAIDTEISNMSLRLELTATGSTRVTSHDGKFVKQPDASWTLERQPRWPTLIVEAGLSETKHKLAIDAQGWLEADGSETNIVVTGKIDRATPQVEFQPWEDTRRQLYRPITRSYRPVASGTQCVNVTRTLGVTKVTGDLTVSFEKMLDRPKRNANEHDVVIDKAMLQAMAETVWKRQGFM